MPVALAGFALATLLLIAAGVAALREHSATVDAGDWAHRTFEIVTQVGRVRDALLDAETGQRGYLLTGATSYLESYASGVAEVPAQLRRLRELTQDDPEERARVAALEPIVAAKLDEMRRTIELRRRGDEAGALAIVGTAEGKNTMDRVRMVLGALEARGSQLLAVRMAIRAQRSREAASLIAGTTVGGVLVTLLSFVLLMRATRAQERAEAHVRDAEQQLRAALSQSLAYTEAFARAVLDTTASAIISIDAEGCVTSFNKAAERMFGYAAAEMVGRNVKLLMPAPYRDEHDEYLRRYLDTGVPRIIGVGREVKGLRRDGTVFPMHLAVDDTVLNGEHLFTGAVRDLTEQREAEERERRLLKQARQNERLADIGAVTARIAHDFGNPLAGLHMAVQRMLILLSRQPVQIEPLRQVVETMVPTVKRLDKLVAEFKLVAREQRLHVSEIGVASFLREVASAWHEEAYARGITLETDVARPLPIVRADQDKLRQVMDNLVKNALEAIQRGPGVVRIIADTDRDGWVRIRVEDSGPGIPEDVDVFALFETTKPTGTGLGLAICRQIALAHGGTIECTARTPGGTVFALDIPAHGPGNPAHGPVTAA